MDKETCVDNYHEAKQESHQGTFKTRLEVKQIDRMEKQGFNNANKTKTDLEKP